MAIPVTCKACGSGFQVRDDFAGKRGRCPTCGEVVDVPAGNPPPAWDQEPPPPREEERRDPPSSKSRPAYTDRDSGRSSRRDRDRDDRDRDDRDDRDRDRDRDVRDRNRDYRERDRDDRDRDDRDRDRDDRDDRDRGRSRRYDDSDRGSSRRSRRVGYGWLRAAGGATPMMVGYILLAVACLDLLICEFGAFGTSPLSYSDMTPSQRSQMMALVQSSMRNLDREDFGRPRIDSGPTLGTFVKLVFIFTPAHPYFLLVGVALAIAGAVFLAIGHGRFRAAPIRPLGGYSALGALFSYLSVGLLGLGLLLGFIYTISDATSGILLAMPFYSAVLAAIGILVSQLLHGIAVMFAGARYRSAGLRWFSLGVWIAVAVLILLLVIFALTTISDGHWARVFAKDGGGYDAKGPFRDPPSQTNGLYAAFLILSLVACVVSIFPLLMARRELLTGEPPAAPPPPRRPRRGYDEDDDRPRNRDRDRYRDDDEDDYDRPRRRERDDY